MRSHRDQSRLHSPIVHALGVPAHMTTKALEEQARDVEHRIKTLEHRPRPTPSERALTAELKKLRLAVKDRLTP